MDGLSSVVVTYIVVITGLDLPVELGTGPSFGS